MKQIVVTLHIVCTDDAFDDLLLEAIDEGYEDAMEYLNQTFNQEFDFGPNVILEAVASITNELTIQT